MSFLLSALGSLGSALLPKASSFLGSMAAPFSSKIASHFTKKFEGGGIGRTVMDGLYNTGVNAAYDGVQKFAKSDWL